MSGLERRLALTTFLALICASNARLRAQPDQPAHPPDYNFYDSRTWGASAPPGMGLPAAEQESAQAAQIASLGAGVVIVPGRSGTTAAEVYRLDGMLTPPAATGEETIARVFLQTYQELLGLAGTSVFSLPLDRRYESKAARLTHLVFRQQYIGIGVFGGDVRVHLTGDGSILRVQSGAAWPGKVASALAPALSAVDAFAAAARVLLRPPTGAGAADAAAVAPQPAAQVLSTELGAERISVLAASGWPDPIPAKLSWFPRSSDAVLVWELYLRVDSSRWYCVLIDAASGELLFSQNLYRDQSPRGSVFRAGSVPYPSAGSPSIENFMGWPASSGNCPALIYPAQFRSGAQLNLCWVSSTQTSGNNVTACLDASGTNQCDWKAFNAQADFEFPFSNSYATSGNAAPDQSAAVTNLFYWNNVLHDWLYSLGFDEPSGNFQADNFGRGGFGGDPVLADAQDGAGLNNESFATPPDGSSPRMEVFLFTNNGTYLRRDGDFSGDLIAHEYVHGLTTRLVGAGGPNALARWQSGSMGEGWSDGYACSLINNPVFGQYVSATPSTGMRSVAYNNSPYTYGQFGTLYRRGIGPLSLLIDLPEAHRDGEIWASLLWDLRAALGQSVFEHLVTAALKLTPARPSMLDARNAIVQAAQAMGVNACAVWVVFAQRGLGASAALNHVQAGQPNDTALSVYEAHDVPATCGGQPPQNGATVFFDDMESGVNGWTVTGLWHQTTRRAAGGAHSWWYGQESAGNYSTGAANSGSLASPPIALATGVRLTLEWDQFFQGEGFGRCYPLSAQGCNPYLNYDSGWVQVSTDGGATWWVLTTLAHNTDGASFDHHRVDLTRYAGGTILLRFFFDTLDAVANTNEGWYIDNVAIRRVLTGIPALGVTPSSLSFSAAAAGANPAAQLLAVSNLDSGVLNWTVAASSSGWLAVAPASGSGNATLSITAAINGLAAGNYSGTITVTAAGATGSPAVIPAVLTVSGPVAQWRLDDTGAGAGVALADSSGNGHGGATNGYGSAVVPGVLGSARAFNGFTDWGDMGASAAYSPASFTFRAWVKVLSYPAAAGWGVIAADYGGNYQGWYAAVNSIGHVILAVASLPSSAPWLVSANALALGRWYCITATYDGATRQGSIYINGALDEQAAFPGFTPQSATPLTLARASWFDSYYLNAALDEAELLDVSLGSAQVLGDYQSFPAPPTPAPNTSIAADWHFDDTGATLADSSGNTHDGVIAGASVTSGVLNNARSFNGSGDSVSIAATDAFGAASFTVRLWLKLASYPTAAGWGVAVSDYGGNYQGWYIGVHQGGRIIFSVASLPSSSPWLLSTSSLALNRWYYVAATWDGGARLATIYIDGVADAQVALPGFTPAPSTIAYFGRASWYAGYYLNAAIDETRISASARSAGEILSDFQQFPVQPPVAPAAEWKLDDSGATLTDSSGNSHNGVAHGTASVPGERNSARSFNGASDWVDVPASAALSPSSFTIRAWVKLGALPANWGAIAANYGGSYQGWYLGVNSTGQIIFSLSTLPASSPWLLSTTALALSTWYYVAATYDGVTRAGTIYINGTQDAQAVFPGFTPQSAVDLALGRASWYDGNYLNGVLDEIRLLGTSQSPAEVLSDYQTFP